MNRWWRFFKHRWMDPADSRKTLPEAAARRLTERVAAGERRHTGEVRVCVEAALPLSYLWPPPDDAELPAVLRRRALAWFGKLLVWDTRDNNGVLIYVQLAERGIEIIADRGLNDRIGSQQWQALLERMREDFRAGRFEQGLAAAIDEVSTVLAVHFPEDPSNPKPNELPDAVVLR